MRQWDDRRRLRQIRIPTLLMWGEGDQVFGRLDQDALLDGIPGSRLVAYAGVGHAPHWEVPGAFASDLLGFLEEEQERR
jgi:pimeloyl-ACP methyl ester carboxylesterase